MFLTHPPSEPAARFTKYLTTILRLYYDNAKVTIDLRQASNLLNILRRMQGFYSVRFTRKNRKIASADNVRKFSYDIFNRNFNTSYVNIVRRSYDQLKIIL